MRKSRQKLTSILSFLDEVEEEIERNDVTPSNKSARGMKAFDFENGQVSPSSRYSSQASEGIDGASPVSLQNGRADKGNIQNGGASLSPRDSDDDFEVLQGASAVDAIKSRMAELRVNLDDKEKTVMALREALEQTKKRNEKHVAALKEEHEIKLAELRAENDEAANRQLSFIDSLLQDKADLTQQCEDLSQGMVDLKKKVREKLESERESMRVSMWREKEQILTSEKVKREKWMANKTKSIREMTIKGLEPEIQTLIAKNKSDREQSAEELKAALRSQKEDLTIAFQDQLHKLREELLKEKTEAVEEERVRASHRLREYIERYDKQMRDQQERFQADLAAERERVVKDSRKQLDSLRAAVESTVSGESNKLQKLRDQHQEEMDEYKRRVDVAAKQESEKHALENEQWREQVLSKLNRQLVTKEAQIETRLTAERDAKLSQIVERLTVEHQRDLDESVRLATKKLAEENEKLRIKVREAQDKSDEVSKAVLQLEEQLFSVRRELEAVSAERDALASKAETVDTYAAERERVATEPLRRRVVELEDTVATLTAERNDARSSLETIREDQREMMQKTLEAYESRKAAELDSLTTRVKQAIEKKDAVITELKQKVRSREEKIRHMNTLLEQQRKELVQAIS